MGFEKAVTAGATSIKNPIAKPWGQIVAEIKCPDGILFEICSPVNP